MRARLLLLVAALCLLGSDVRAERGRRVRVEKRPIAGAATPGRVGTKAPGSSRSIRGAARLTPRPLRRVHRSGAFDSVRRPKQRGPHRLGRRVGEQLRRNRALRSRVREIAFLDGLIPRLFDAGSGQNPEIYLKGSSLYRTVAAVDRRVTPPLRDIDLILVGVTADQVLRTVSDYVGKRVDYEIEPPFLPGVTHLQIQLPAEGGRAPMELDLSIYPPEQREWTRLQFSHYPGVSFAKMKLKLARGSFARDLLTLSRSSTLGELGRYDPTTPGRSKGRLYDPANGLRDAESHTLRVPAAGKGHERLPEGALHSLWLIGKYPDLRLAKSTQRLYNDMEAADLRAFFDIGNRHDATDTARSMAAARTNYLLRPFRAEADRNIRSVLDMGRRLGVFTKALEGMAVVTGDEALWRATQESVAEAHRVALAEGKEHQNRAWVFGALLSHLPSEVAVRRAIEPLYLPPEPNRFIDYSVEDVLRGYRDARQRRASAGEP